MRINRGRISWDEIWDTVSRTKDLKNEKSTTELSRCLNRFELISLGVGFSISNSIYIFGGQVIKDFTGPSICALILIPGLLTLCASFCYAELASYAKKSGSVYRYTYAAFGETAAIFVAWNAILCYLSLVVLQAKIFSVFIDDLVDQTVSKATLEACGNWQVAGLEKYPDLLAAGIVLLIFCAAGLKLLYWVRFHHATTFISTVSFFLVILAGFILGNIGNLSNTASGGFFPHGYRTALLSPTMILMLPVGFDSITFLAEESVKPTDDIPTVTLLTSTATVVTRFLGTISLACVVPFYEIDIYNPFHSAFGSKGAAWAQIATVVAVVSASISSLSGIVMSLTRLVYIMACDGLLFKAFSSTNSATHVPIFVTFISALVCTILTTIINFHVIVPLAYLTFLINLFVASFCIMKLHYSGDTSSEEGNAESDGSDESIQRRKRLRRNAIRQWRILSTSPGSAYILFMISQVITIERAQKLALFIMLTSTVSVSCLAQSADTKSPEVLALFIFLIVCLAVSLIFLLLINGRKSDGFQVPLMPILPVVNMLVLAGMMTQVDRTTCLTLLGWTLLGTLLSYGYGTFNSKEKDGSYYLELQQDENKTNDEMPEGVIKGISLPNLPEPTGSFREIKQQLD